MDVFSIIGCITGILGFIISLINLAYFFVIRNMKLNVRFGVIRVKIKQNHNSNELDVYFSFENKSQLPISVTRVQVIVDDRPYDCIRMPVKIEQMSYSQNNEVYDRDTLKSTTVPINLAPLAAESGFLAYLIPKGTLSGHEKALTFRICTNRGNIVQKTFELHEDYLLTRFLR